MTRNRARKQAARQRAALTGERYVVAQRAVAERAVAEPQPPRGGRLHDLTHRMPGVPAHVEGGLQRAGAEPRRTPHRTRTSTPRRHTQPQHHEPRVLVAWQQWIARRLGAGSR